MESSSGGKFSSFSRKLNEATSQKRGVQKFYTKIRHKIEDSMQPKISVKLNKNISRNSQEESRPVPPPRGLTASRKQTDMDLVKESSNRISSNPNGLVDSDEDECQKSLDDSTLSLEDEIFEELEKVAHDEAKLSEVLKSFDKILTDFTSPVNTTKVSKSPGTIVKSGDRPAGHKPLQKSKTCSIIESRCILKKSVSDSPYLNGEMSIQPLSMPTNDIQHFAALQVTKSLWNLQDLETFAKSGRKLEKFDCRLPVLKSNFNRNKVEKSISNPETAKTTNCLKKVNSVSSNAADCNNQISKIQLPKATSVWEISPQISMNSHSPCGQTLSGSKIPIKKVSPQRLASSGRSNSFCDQMHNIKMTTTTPPPQKIIQIGKVLPIPKRNQSGKITTVNRIVKNLNGNDEMVKTCSTKKVGSVSSSSASCFGRMAMSTSATASSTSLGNKRRGISTAVSTPHSLNKLGITVKSSTVALSSAVAVATTSTSKSKASLKSANSELSLNALRSVKGSSSRDSYGKKPAQQNDLLLDKCLEKGQQILRKVEAFGNITKQEHSNDHQKNLVSQTQSKRSLGVRKEIPLDNRKIAKNKSSEGNSLEKQKKMNFPKIYYAKECIIESPRLESCKIFPPILCHPSQQHAELLVNVKTTQLPLRVHQDSMLCINSDIIRNEKDYHSDCSDDSGHISNENDELTIISSENHDKKSALGVCIKPQKINKISKLVEKFELPSLSSSFYQGSPEINIFKGKSTTTIKIAEVKPVTKIVSSSMEIYPTYSSEVIIQIQ